MLTDEVTRDPAKPFVKRLEGFDPPRYAVEYHGEVRTRPTTFDQALKEANAIAAADVALAGLLAEYDLDNDTAAAVDALEYIFPGESDVDPCP